MVLRFLSKYTSELYADEENVRTLFQLEKESPHFTNNLMILHCLL